jgi:hypothetical protein
LSKRADGQCVVALGEAGAVFVGEQTGVKVGRSGEVKGALEEDLAGGGFEQVAAADYFGNVGVGVIDDAGELIAGETVLSPDKEVAEVFAGGEGLWAEIFVLEADCLAVRNAEAVVDALLELGSGCIGGWAAGAGIDGLVVGVFMRCVHHGGEIFATAMAWVDLSGNEEWLEGFAIEREALGLVEDGRMTGDPEPGQVFEDGLSEVGF